MLMNLLERHREWLIFPIQKSHISVFFKGSILQSAGYTEGKDHKTRIFKMGIIWKMCLKPALQTTLLPMKDSPFAVGIKKVRCSL